MLTVPETHPLLLENLKAAYSPADVIGATVRVLDGYGSKGAKARPFNQKAAVAEFRSWAYKAALLNANKISSITMRLYVPRNGSASFKGYRTKKTPGHRLRHLKSGNVSRFVARKVAEFDGDFEEVTESHPVLKVLMKPNPWMNAFDLTQMRLIYLQLTGNAYTHLVLDKVMEIPSELWPMPSQYVGIKPDPRTFIAGYIYGRGQEIERFFPPDEVIHNKLPNPSDPYYGMGMVEAAWTALGLHKSKRVMDQAKFDNMNRPDWAIIFKNGAKPEALTRFETVINEKFQGPGKSGKFLALGADASLQQLNQEMEEIGDADRVVEEISAAFGVPVSMLKANDPNRASAQTADTAWLRDTVRPLAMADEEALNAQFLPLFDVEDGAFLAYDPVSFEDETTQRKNAGAGLAGGMLTVNEAREEIGYEPVDDGDMRFFPSGATGPNAGLLGDAAPGQSTERTNEDGVTPGGGLPVDSSA